jgi:hypothetical protein
MDLPVKSGNHLRAAARLVGLSGIKEDLNVVNDLCLEALKLIADDVQNVHGLDEQGRTWLHAYYLSAVVTYARCFNGGQRTRLEEVHVRRAAGGQADAAVKVHQVMMLTRDKHLAHPVSPYEEGICGIIARPDGTVWGIDTHLYKQTTAPHAFGQLRLLVANLLPVVNEMILSTRAAMLNEANGMSPEEIAALPDAEWIPPDLADLSNVRSDPRTAADGAWTYAWQIEVDDEALVRGQIARSGPDGPMRRRKSVTVTGSDKDTVWDDLGSPES